MSDKNIWLAAYPKTGSTWLRAIIQQLLSPEARPKEAIPSFDKDYPHDGPTYAVMGSETRILRTHCHPEHRAFHDAIQSRSDEIIGILTIQRHPLDVLLSQLNYSFILGREKSFKNGVLKKVEEIIGDGEVDYYIDGFIEVGGCPEHVGRCGPYADFYTMWRAFASDAAHLHLRYEEMVSEPIAAIDAIQAFFDLSPKDSLEVADAVEMRTQVNGKFFWRKRAYNYRELLPQASIWRFEQGFSEGLQALGYPEEGVPSTALQQ